MYITYEEFLSIKGMECAQIMAGNEGLDRFIKGAHVIELVNGKDFAKPGELVFFSGVGMKNPDTDFTYIIQTLSEKQIAGLVVELGPFIPALPEDAIRCADALHLPLITLPFEVPVSDIISQVFYQLYSRTQNVHSSLHFMKTFFLGGTLPSTSAAASYGFTQGQPYYIAACGYEAASPVVSSDKEALLFALQHGCSTRFYTETSYGYLFMFPASYVSENLSDYLNDLHQKMAHTLFTNGRNTSIFLGCSQEFSSLETLREHIRETEQCVRVLQTVSSSEQVLTFHELGVYRLLLEVPKKESLETLMNEYLGTLLRFDAENDSVLTETLKVYLEEGCSITHTTEALFVHRNTVKYRLKKITELLSGDLKNGDYRFQLQLALKIKAFLGL